MVGDATGSGKAIFIKKYLEGHKNIIYLSTDSIAEELARNNLMAARVIAG